MDEQTIKTRISALPQSPGIYIYTDTTGNVLYVGKAKNLRSRVRSYFGKSADLGPAKEKMVKLIADIETIATHTELEALVLEANLIRKHQPPYNVLLRDDKYYLFIKITKDIPARIFPVRKIIQDGSKYFGPYSSASSVRTTLKLLRRIFPFREEKDRPRDIIFPHTLFKNYLSPSYEGEREGVVRDELKRNDPSTPPLIRGEENATNVARFLNGNRQEIIRTLQQGIEDAAKDLHYEQAALFRDQLQAIERLEGSQKVYLPRKVSFDIISISQAKHQSAGNVLQIREGKLIGKQTFLLRHRSFVMPEDILRQFIMQYYSVAQDVPKKIFIPIPLPDAKTLAEWIQNFSPPYQGGVGGGDVVEFAVPLRGTKKQLLAMGELNAKNLLREEEIETKTAGASKEALTSLLEAIHMGHLIEQAKTMNKKIRIETYDISNIQGTLATASMIVFIDGVPAKDQYRKFKIRFNQELDPSKHKSNDFAMLEEALSRRLARGSSGDWPLPDLIIIDGGKGQLSSAQKALKKSGMDIPMISIAKREEELFLPNNPVPVLLPYNSPALHLIQRMRDEAHRFTITYHRKLRSREQIKSALDEVPGIGPKTKKLLLKTFGSVAGIKKANSQQLEEIIGKKKAELLQKYI